MSTEKRVPESTDKLKDNGSSDSTPDYEPLGPGTKSDRTSFDTPSLPGKEGFDPWKRHKDEDL